MTAPLFLDFETYYDKDYSLSKMPTMQYVRDPRFECLGVALAVGGDPAAWLPGPAGLELESLRNQVSGQIVVAHNAAFDAAVLDRILPGVEPKLWICTMNWSSYAISQGVLPADARTGLGWWGDFLGIKKGDTAAAVEAGGDELEAYAEQDINILRSVFEWLQEHCPWPSFEARVSDLHVRMAANPRLELDQHLLESLVSDPIPEASQLRSRNRFAEILRAAGVEPGVKPGARGDTYAFAKTDKFMQDLAQHPDPVVRKLHELKTEGGSTIESTRAQRFLDVGSPLPVPLWYYGAHTGRASGGEGLNLQNLPSGPLRQSIQAPVGYKLVSADYSQIEARVIAWGAGCDGALAPFVTGRDPYRETATTMYGVAYEDVTPDQRARSKAAILALGFGQGSGGFQTFCQQFRIDMDQRTADWMVSTFRRERPELVEFWHLTFQRLMRQGYLELPSGRLLTYPDLSKTGGDVSFQRHQVFSRGRGRQRVNLWHGIAAQNWTQAAARDIIYHAALNMPWRVVMQVHDELVLIVPEDTEDIEGQVTRVMLDLPAWAEGLPADCEVDIMDNYGGAS